MFKYKCVTEKLLAAFSSGSKNRCRRAQNLVFWVGSRFLLKMQGHFEIKLTWPVTSDQCMNIFSWWHCEVAKSKQSKLQSLICPNTQNIGHQFSAIYLFQNIPHFWWACFEKKHNWTLLHMFRKMLICHVSLAGACVSLTLNIFDLHQICHTACPWNISQMRNNEIMLPEKIYDHWSLCFTNLWSVDYRGKFAKWWRCKFLTNLFDICKQQIRNSDLWQRIWIQNN